MQQNFRMLHHWIRLFLQSPLRPASVLVFHLVLTDFCKGQSQLIGPSQPIVATLGHDIILPCHLEPAVDVADMTLEWTRPDLDPIFVYVRRFGQEIIEIKHPSYKDRTSVFISELKHGNISLKLSAVKPSDEGTYHCYIPKLKKGSSVQLVVASGSVSSPAVTLAGIDRNRGGLVLQCESEGWYPEPEVSWLDAEGHVLSAGPTETVRGPDGLYTVSSRVTVEERHRNNFTCRVQQKDINQIRETQIHVPDDFFELQSSSSALTAGLAVSLTVCILIILLFVFLFWRQNRIKTKRNHRDETDGGQKKKHHETEDQFVTAEETERQWLRTDETMEMVEDKQAELQNLKEQLENKNKEVQSLTEEKEKNETEWQQLHNGLETIIKTFNDGLWKPGSLFPSPNMSHSHQHLLKVDHLISTVQKLTAEKLKLEHQQQLDEQKEKFDQQLQDQMQRQEKPKKGPKQILPVMMKKESADKQEKKPKKELKTKKDESKSEASMNLQGNKTNSSSQSLTTGLELDVDTTGKSICLSNTSTELQQLRGWKLEAKINETKTFKYKFEKSVKLSPQQTVTIWRPGLGPPPFNLVWEDLQSVSFGDKLQVNLISDTGKTRSTQSVQIGT